LLSRAYYLRDLSPFLPPLEYELRRGGATSISHLLRDDALSFLGYSGSKTIIPAPPAAQIADQAA
jgi:hypothetical protein